MERLKERQGDDLAMVVYVQGREFGGDTKRETGGETGGETERDELAMVVDEEGKELVERLVEIRREIIQQLLCMWRERIGGETESETVERLRERLVED